MAFRSTDAALLINNRIDKKLISTLESNFVLQRFAEQRPLEKNQGDTVQLTFWNNPAISTGQADELSSGNENSATFTNAYVTIGFYADDYAFSELSEAVDKSGSIQTGHVGRAIYQVSGTIDTVCRDALSAVTTASTRVVNGLTVATLTATDTANIAEINHIYTVLDGRNVHPHPMTGGNYAAIFHTRPCGDIRADTGGTGGFNDMTWNDWSRRTSPGNLKTGDVGDMIGIRPYKSTNIQRLTNTGGIAYYNNFVLGNEAFVTTSINGLAAPAGTRGGKPLVRVIPKMFSHSTPYANKVRVVWKVYFGAAIIDEQRMMMLQTASAA